MTRTTNHGNLVLFCEVCVTFVFLHYDVIEGLFSNSLLFVSMEEIGRGHRTIHLHDVIEIVRNPNSGFDPEPVTISQVGYLIILHVRYLPKIQRGLEPILRSSASIWLFMKFIIFSKSIVIKIIMIMQRCSVNHWLLWDYRCSM